MLAKVADSANHQITRIILINLELKESELGPTPAKYVYIIPVNSEQNFFLIKKVSLVLADGAYWHIQPIRRERTRYI